MNSKEVQDALRSVQQFKPEPKQPPQQQEVVRNNGSFVSVWDQLDKLDVNPFNVGRKE